MKQLPVAYRLFADRRAEVFVYLRFLRSALGREAKLSYVDGRRAVELKIDRELTHTLKANTYLLLYSLVEATMNQMMVEIHHAIEASDAHLDELRHPLAIEILQRSMSIKSEITKDKVIAPIGRSLVRVWLEEFRKARQKTGGYLFSGNIDGRAIRETGAKYGFATGDRGKDSHLNHDSLLKTKTSRNRLAHGDVSFRDFGRDLSQEELFAEAFDLMRCMSRVLSTVDRYLARKGYLNSSPGP